MKKHLNFLDVNNRLTKTRTSLLGHDSDIPYFYRTLVRELKKCQGKLLILDFENIKMIDRPDRFFQNTLGRIIEESHPFVVAGVNVNFDVKKSLETATSISQILFDRNIIFLLLDQQGNIDWMGIRDEKISEALTEIFTEGEIEETELSRRINLGSERLKTISVLIKANRHLFEVDERKQIIYRLAFDREELNYLIRSHFEKRYKMDVEKLEMKLEGHFNLPCGMHSQSIFVTSMIVNNPQLVKRLALEIIRRFSKRRFDTIVCYSLLGLYVAKEMCDLLKNIRYVATYGYPTPLPRFGEEIEQNERVLIITDAVCSGRSLSALRNFVNVQGGSIIGLLSVFDPFGSRERTGNDAIFSYQIKNYSFQKCKFCEEKQPLFDVDAFTSIPRSSKPDKVQTGEGTLDPSVFWEMIIKNHALKQGHWSFNGHHFSIFIETTKLLRNREYLKTIAEEIVIHYGCLFDYIIYPSHESAFLMAQAVSEAIERRDRKKPIIIPTSKNRFGNKYIIPFNYEKLIKGRTVLVIDDGANFGETLIGIHFLLCNLGPKTTNFCVLLDRLTGVYRQNVDLVLGPDRLFSLFYLPYSAYHSDDCPTCRERKGLLIDKNTELGSLVNIERQYERTQLNFIEGKWL